MASEGGWRDLRSPSRPVDIETTPFEKLIFTHALAVAGDTLVTMALAGSLFFSISPGAARGKVALSLILTMAPFAVVAPFLGPMIDRSGRGRRLMLVGACLGRAVTAYAMARFIHDLLLFPAAFATLVLSKGYAVAKTALVPAAVQDDDELVEANAKLSIVGVVAGFAAAVPGVIALRLLDARWALYLAMVIFVVAAAFGVRVRDRRAPDAAAPEHRVGGAPVKVPTRREGDPPPGSETNDLNISAAAVAMALLRAIVGFLTFLIAFGFRRIGAPSWWFGVALAASYAGSLGSSLIAPRLRHVLREETLIGACLLAVAVANLAVRRLDGALWVSVVAVAVGLGAGVAKLSFDALVQRDAPPQLQGRSFARFEAGFQIAWVAGALLPVVITTPLDRGYDVMAAATLLAGIAYIVARRSIRRSYVHARPA